jgi:hypothetical protein
MLNKPYSGPSDIELREMFSTAGFVNITIEERTLPLRFEGGIQEALSSLMATPLAPVISTLSPEKRSEYQAAAQSELGSLVKDGVLTSSCTAWLVRASK